VRLVAVPDELRERASWTPWHGPPGAPFTNRQITDVTLPGVIAVRRLCLAIYALKTTWRSSRGVPRSWR
jgi:hypothetical protein